MLVTRAAILSFLVAGSNAFAPSQPTLKTAKVVLQSAVAAPDETATDVDTPTEGNEESNTVDLSIPYDATVQLAYDESDKSEAFEDFKPKYLAQAIAEVVSKQPVDISVPYDATVQLAFAESDRSMPYEEFKPKYLADAVAQVVAKQSGDVAVLEEPTPVAAEESVATEETEKKDEIVYYKRPVIEKTEVEEVEDDVVYYKRNVKALDSKDIYLWTPKDPNFVSTKKNREGKYTLKANDPSVEKIAVKKTTPIKVTRNKNERYFALKNNEDKAMGIKSEAKIAAEEKKIAKIKENPNAVGIFAPAVILTKDVIGITELNKLRGKIIKLHTDVIGGFTETAQTDFGNAVLKVLFDLADKNGDGTIDEEELTVALNALGFDFLKEKEIAKIFKKADGDDNGKLDFEEWQEAAPKVLKGNLVKLAKKNGHDLGFLA